MVRCPFCNRVVSSKSKECFYCHANFISDKRILPALLLCLLFGWFGFHRFYVGKVGSGILMLLTFGGGGLWVLIDLVAIIVGAFEDGDNRKVEVWT
jgi:TM2 domain-containing membrane protein YozV